MTKSMRKARAALQNHPRCGAKARTTGQPCKGWAMKNGRCRMHGGKSTGRPIIHGRYTKAAKADRRETQAMIRELLSILGEIE
jgi:hypothetical protein